MHMEIIYKGKTYVGKTIDIPGTTAEVTAASIYGSINELNKLQIPLQDDSILVIGSEVISNSVFRFFPDKGVI